MVIEREQAGRRREGAAGNQHTHAHITRAHSHSHTLTHTLGRAQQKVLAWVEYKKNKRSLSPAH